MNLIISPSAKGMLPENSKVLILNRENCYQSGKIDIVVAINSSYVSSDHNERLVSIGVCQEDKTRNLVSKFYVKSDPENVASLTYHNSVMLNLLSQRPKINDLGVLDLGFFASIYVINGSNPRHANNLFQALEKSKQMIDGEVITDLKQLEKIVSIPFPTVNID
jgi:hypothetical protein